MTDNLFPSCWLIIHSSLQGGYNEEREEKLIIDVYAIFNHHSRNVLTLESWRIKCLWREVFLNTIEFIISQWKKLIKDWRRAQIKASLCNSRRGRGAARDRTCSPSVAAFDWCMTLARSRSSIFQTSWFLRLQWRADRCRRRWHCVVVDQSPSFPPLSTFALSCRYGQSMTRDH